MTTPARSPLITLSERCHQELLSVPNTSARMPNVANPDNTAAKLVPKLIDFRSSFIPAPSLVLTVKIQRTESRTPTAAISIGAIMAFICIAVPSIKKADAPSAIVERMEPQ